MPAVKICPSCLQSYPDISLNFCLEDGSRLSDSFEFSVPTQELDETETIVRKTTSQKQKGALTEEIPYAKTKRTQEEHPVISSPIVSTRPLSQWTSSDFVRQVTFDITGTHTFHAQESLELIREFLNTELKGSGLKFLKVTWQLGRGHFHLSDGVFTFDFQKSAKPTAVKFLMELLKHS